MRTQPLIQTERPSLAQHLGVANDHVNPTESVVLQHLMSKENILDVPAEITGENYDIRYFITAIHVGYDEVTFIVEHTERQPQAPELYKTLRDVPVMCRNCMPEYAAAQQLMTPIKELYANDIIKSMVFIYINPNMRR